MKPKIGISYYVGSKPHDIKKALDIGCDYIEVSTEYPTMPPNVKLLNEIKKAGLDIAFHSPIGAIQIFNPIPEVSKISLKVLKKILKFSEKFEPFYFNIHQTIDLITYNFVEEQIEKKKTEVAKILNKYTTFPLTFENTPRKALSTPDQFSFIKSFDNLFICLDVGHIPLSNREWSSNYQMTDWIKKFGKKILVTHIHNTAISSEGKLVDHLSFEIDGLVNIIEVKKLLQNVSYCLIEIFFRNTKKQPFTWSSINKTLKLIKNV